MARAAGIAAGLAVAGLLGWYAWTRATAGNQYAQGGKVTQKAQQAQPLRYFSPDEFGDWWALMNTDLVRKLDEFRHRLGAPVMISPAPGALGRYAGASLSQHNVDAWGEVRAADVMPLGVDLHRAYKIAREVGFTGIGVYPDWAPRPGLHLDIRPAPLALWSGLDDESGRQYYAAIDAAWSRG